MLKSMAPYVCVKDFEKCIGCGFCETTIYCPNPGRCIGCLACYKGCPNNARKILEDHRRRKTIKVKVNGETFEVPEGVTVKRALELIGFRYSKFPEEGALYAPCEVGACYSCVLELNGELRRSCVNPVVEGMRISTTISEDYVPRRPIHGPEGHMVGGVGTPWWLKERGFVEVAIWTAGCNLSCPQCQNYSITYDGRSVPFTPREAAEKVTYARRLYGVDRMAISGGEPTINRKWLISYFKELRSLNRDEKARFHLDTNTTILTKDYVDELILDAGVTDIGPDLKGLRTETFMKITGIESRDLAARFVKTSWDAVKYIIDNYYPEKVFIGIGVPYNKALITLDEIYEIGSRISSMNPEVQVCLLDYFPTFKRMDMRRPTVREMAEAKRALEEGGCRVVVAQTRRQLPPVKMGACLPKRLQGWLTAPHRAEAR